MAKMEIFLARDRNILQTIRTEKLCVAACESNVYLTYWLLKQGACWQDISIPWIEKICSERNKMWIAIKFVIIRCKN